MFLVSVSKSPDLVPRIPTSRLHVSHLLRSRSLITLDPLIPSSHPIPPSSDLSYPRVTCIPHAEDLTTRIVEVAGFFLLQIGLPVIKFNGWTLFSDAVFQSLSVRASGFNILPIANFAPSLLYVPLPAM